MVEASSYSLMHPPTIYLIYIYRYSFSSIYLLSSTKAGPGSDSMCTPANQSIKPPQWILAAPQERAKLSWTILRGPVWIVVWLKFAYPWQAGIQFLKADYLFKDFHPLSVVHCRLLDCFFFHRPYQFFSDCHVFIERGNIIMRTRPLIQFAFSMQSKSVFSKIIPFKGFFSG